jgi:hypothetical protein
MAFNQSVGSLGPEGNNFGPAGGVIVPGLQQLLEPLGGRGVSAGRSRTRALHGRRHHVAPRADGRAVGGHGDGHPQPGRSAITSGNFTPGRSRPASTINPNAPVSAVVNGPFTPGTIAPGVSQQRGKRAAGRGGRDHQRHHPLDAGRVAGAGGAGNDQR